ncbi:MAG: hypothetical protein OQK82_06340, partial [Candidatus Pacearchaeota archaeon]|nr:hypothetical protein [Candidatus Pacearchaeota archaeon]
KNLEETVPEDLVSIPGGPLITVIGDYDGFIHDNIRQPVKESRHYPQIGSTAGIDYATKNPAVIVRVGGNDKAATDENYVFPLWYSMDTGKTWTQFASHPDPGQNYRGKIAVSADGTVVLWNPEGKNVLLRTDDRGTSWTTCEGVSAQKCFPTADPVDENVFYAFSSGVCRSNDKGVHFTRVDNENFSWTSDMQVTPGREGHIWVTGFAWDGINGGFLARSTDGGETFMQINPEADPQYTRKIQHCEAVGFGKQASGASYPAIYFYGTIDGIRGVFQSIDEAKTWVRIDDDQHQYGALSNGNFIRGDANRFGVVYRSTAGRGIAVRYPTEEVEVSQKKNDFKPEKISAPSINWSAYRNRTIRFYSLTGQLLYQNKISGTIHSGKVNPVLSRLIHVSGMVIIRIVQSDQKVILHKKVILR